MTAGRELDALIAEKVMGLVKCTGPQCDIFYCYAKPESSHMGGEAPCYSTDIAAAWKVVENLMKDGWEVTVNAHGNTGEWECEVEFSEAGEPDHRGRFYLLGDTAPHAICLAALKTRR